MSKTNEQVEKRPFHETIVEAIQRCSSPSTTGEILRLFQLIKDTKIPKGHGKISAAIDEFFNFPGAEKWAREIKNVKDCLLKQKDAASKKNDSEIRKVNLDDLREETKNLLALLEVNQPGLSSWNDLLRRRLKNMHKLTSPILGK